jgi:hypothetical protein
VNANKMKITAIYNINFNNHRIFKMMLKVIVKNASNSHLF